MRFAYADPPYLGYSRFYGDDLTYDSVEAHRGLLDRLCREFDAWAYSLTSNTLRTILPLCAEDVRVGAWVKPFASFKPGVNPAYAWEPVLFRGGRKRGRSEPTVRDWLSESVTLGRGFVGAKPEAFAFWIFELLGARPDDEFTDLFPGSGSVSRAWEQWRRQGQLFAGRQP